MAARARIVHYWPEGGKTLLEVAVEETFADHCDEARVQVIRMWRETCADSVEAEDEA
jgi:hypothetical protein